MRTTFTCSLETLAEWYRRKTPSWAFDESGARVPIDTSKIVVRTDEQIRNVLWRVGMMHHFEINHWFSFVSWSRAAEDPATIHIVVEGDGSQFEAAHQAITAELSYSSPPSGGEEYEG
jgi:hypothetical protein